MPEEEKKKDKKQKEKYVWDERCRFTEYYDMQGEFDELYARSKAGEEFTDLMPLILSSENIRLAYRMIKANKGSHTPGTDGKTIDDIGGLPPEEVVGRVRFILTGQRQGYTPLPVRRKEIPKPYDPTKTRPLGIPCIWDRLVQQCVKQIMEPICEAKFSKNSFGFRPNRSVEHAIAAADGRMWHSGMEYAIEFDIKGFFDNVCHSKLIRQIWTLGIHDKKLLNIIRRMLEAPIAMPDGSTVYPDRGTPQGGILSPLLANIVLNELDWWVSSQWETHPLVEKYATVQEDGSLNKGPAFKRMRQTRLKEMYLVRYADDFRIYCKTRNEAKRIKIAVTDWLWKRLRLEVSQEKTRIVNVRQRYTHFLGIKMKVVRKGKKRIVKSHVSDKTLAKKAEALVGQVGHIQRPGRGSNTHKEVVLYNSMVMGMQNYFSMATRVSADFGRIEWRVSRVLYNRLRPVKLGGRLAKTGRKLTKLERERYGDSKMLRYVASTGDPIYPIGYVKFDAPRKISPKTTCYSPEGRSGIHTNLRINTALMHELMRSPPVGLCMSAADCCVSRFSAQKGKCAVSRVEFETLEDIVCHHIDPNKEKGRERYGNLVLVTPGVHRLIHEMDMNAIQKLMADIQLDTGQMVTLNKFRRKAGLPEITCLGDNLFGLVGATGE